MKSRQHCPRCNSLQKFGRQRREDNDLVEIFIRCSKCRWESVVYSGDDSTITSILRSERLRAKAKRDPHLVNEYLKELRKINDEQ